MKYELHQCIASRLRRLSRITDGYLRQVLATFNITENQLNILFALYKTGKIEQGLIGKKLVLGRSTVSRGVRLLENQHYIARTSAYRPEIELTEKGKALVQQIIPVWKDFMAKIHHKIGQEGFEQIEALEKKIS